MSGVASAIVIGTGLNLFGSSKAAKKAKAEAEAAARARAEALKGYTPMQVQQLGRTASGELDLSKAAQGTAISPFSTELPKLSLVEDRYKQPEQAAQNIQLVQDYAKQRATQGIPQEERQMILQKAREDLTKAQTEATTATAAQQRAMGLTGGIASRRQQEIAEQPINEQFANFAYNLGLRSIDEAKQAQSMLLQLSQIETEEERFKYQSEMSRNLFNNQVREQVYALEANQIGAFNDLQRFNKGIELDKIRLSIGSSDAYYSDMAKASTAKYQAVSNLGSSIASLGFMSMLGGSSGSPAASTGTTATSGTIGASNIPVNLGYSGAFAAQPASTGTTFDWQNYKPTL